MPVTVTVSQINRRLSLLVKGDKAIQDVYVKGEVSNFTCHYKTGHLYFSLNEGDCSIKAVMFNNNAEKLAFELEDGMSIIVRCSVQFYEKDGICEIIASEIEPDGIGGAYLAFEQLKNKLAQKGYFEQKRAIPTFPKKICIVTSETGAALQDILNVIERRCPLVKLVLIPTTVQGENAPYDIAEALQKAQETDADLIIFGRGGGSAEDLAAFNTEIVAKAVLDSGIPTISAIGHEIDFTIADFVADLRAPTPSAAAELAVPDISQFTDYITALKTSIRNKLQQKIESSQLEFQNVVRLVKRTEPKQRLSDNYERLQELKNAIEIKYEKLFKRKKHDYENAVSLIEALAPFNILKRGYAAVFKDDKCVSSIKSVNNGDKISVRLGDGELNAEIISVSEIKGIYNDF